MDLSLDWLKSHIDLSDLEPEQVGELLTLHVANVEEVTVPGGGWAGIVVGEVAAVRPHPNADRLRLVTVATAEGPQPEVVCGAPNIAEGQRVCFAPEGTVLPGGFKLKKAKIRGVESRGMVLSERELGLSDEHEGILVLEGDPAVGTPVVEVLPGGTVIEIENKAITTRPDLWGHYGFARELGAVLDRDLRPLDLGDEPPSEPPGVKVRIDAPDLCPRYLGWVIGGIRIEPSPDWLKRRLEEAGQRPINNVVDLTNYILLELGQPIHTFDRRQISGGEIVVRASEPGERVVTLDAVQRTLPDGCCVIADRERTVAIAGVMGCANSEVMEDTTEIILEVANFEMTSIRATSKALALRTESAVRFEKGLDPQGVPVAARRFVQLLREICPTATVQGGPSDEHGELPEARSIPMPAGWIERRLGTPIGADRIDRILTRLGFGVERTEDLLTVAVPSWRSGRDIALPEDVLEEVGRIHGWERIEPIPLLGELEPVEAEPERVARSRARSVLSLRSGLAELHLYPITTEEECRRAAVEPPTLRLANAEQPGLDLMVNSLVPGLLRSVAENLKYRSEVALYLSAPVFLPGETGRSEGLPRENERVGLAIARRDTEAPVLEVKGAIEALLDAFNVRGARLSQEEGPEWLHPGRSACYRRGKQVFGWIGQVHPAVERAFDLDTAVALADIDLDLLRESAGEQAKMRPISRYPTVPYDVALLVDRRTPAAEVESVLRKVDDQLVRSVRLFDVYEGKNLPEGKRSLAFSLVFGSLERTLSGEDVDRLRDSVNQAAEKKGWTIRA